MNIVKCIIYSLEKIREKYVIVPQLCMEPYIVYIIRPVVISTFPYLGLDLCLSFSWGESVCEKSLK